MARITHVRGNLYQFTGQGDTLRPEMSTRSLFEQGLYVDEAGDSDEAVRLYQEVMAKGANTTDWCGALNNIGIIQCARNDFTAAIESFRKVLEVNPRYPLAWYNLGNTLARCSAPGSREAIEAYKKAVALRPSYGDAHYNLASEYDDIGDVRAAIYHFRQYLRCSEDDPTYRYYASRRIDCLREKLPKLVPKPAVAESETIRRTDANEA